MRKAHGSMHPTLKWGPDSRRLSGMIVGALWLGTSLGCSGGGQGPANKSGNPDGTGSSGFVAGSSGGSSIASGSTTGSGTGTPAGGGATAGAAPTGVDASAMSGSFSTTGESGALAPDSPSSGTGTVTTGPFKGGPMPPAACTSYCSAVDGVCTTYPQYKSDADCETTCGVLSAATLTGKDTLACRQMYAAIAATPDTTTAANPKPSGGQIPNCWPAGPFAYALCGDECEAFCAIALTVCPNAYSDSATCKMACGDLIQIPAGDGAYTTSGPTGGNNLACREYYLMASLEDQTNCAYTTARSAMCK
jgi:hypothetical protein